MLEGRPEQGRSPGVSGGDPRPGNELRLEIQRDSDDKG